MSEDSEDEIMGGESHEEMNYRRKYQMLLERCEVLQQDNERIINRIQHVYKYIRQLRKERTYLVKRLDACDDNWRQGINNYLSDSLNRPKPKMNNAPASIEKSSRRSSSSIKKVRSREKDSPRRVSKDGKAWIDKMKVEADHSPKLH